MVSRTRNRAWNASQQGGSVERPWTAPQQHAYPDARTTQGGQFSQNAQASPPQAAAGSTPSSQAGPGTVQPSQPNSAQYAAPNAGPVQGGQGSINGPGSSPQGTAAFSPSSQGTPSQSGTGMAPQQQHPPGPAVPQSYGSSPPAANIVPPQGTQV
ncbi:hypothetical protein KP509_38G028300 [Ceratopteris richardii]|nr:hypothetical protein KP509_38G028300 [Ceratopteris richardii]